MKKVKYIKARKGKKEHTWSDILPEWLYEFLLEEGWTIIEKK